MEFEESDDAAAPGEIGDFPGNQVDELDADLPPEYCQYRDEGCELADSCLNCPFEECIYDEPGGKQSLIKELRDKEMARLFTTDGKGIKELSQMFAVSQRTVQRALKTALSKANKRGQK